jgi:HEPN domain-containing protein
MPPSAAALREAREWLERADRDLGLARQTLAGASPYFEMVAYHSQQAAENALKAFLTASATPFRRTHDVTELQSQCAAISSGFVQFVTAAQILTPYATQFRYPGGPLEPTQAEAQQAVGLADSVVHFVHQTLGV